ncbi:MAG TPA: NrfD/PsrC family molybdoenzyme membrane anchor subunit [Candidatus Deferrimicrobiaceae bacterium]|nr:NrfD/PsrC family molybdoenzyme membrane anchor subunit [Candidatus Deferrimicrobiaceae bacterium]
MNPAMVEKLHELMKQVTGYIYPNEIEVHWGLLIVVYPYITGVVAGAFILASLVKVFNVKEVQPLYRLALLTALAFLLVAPLSLVSHLGHPFRAYEIFLTPQTSSAMAMFGFVYAWYLMVVLLVEIWFDYRKDMIVWAQQETGLMRHVHRVLSLFSTDTSEAALRFDNRALKVITIIGIPSAFLLHGYVGFIFGSIKANPWWSSVLMPIVFLFSAIVSGIALVILLYMIVYPMMGGKIDMKCVDKGMSFLFYAVIVDFSLEFVDFIHRIYQSEEEIKILGELVMNKLFLSLVIIQVLMGMLFPLGILSAIKIFRQFRESEELRKMLYFVSLILIQGGIFATRWNVVIGGQMFSKSFRGLTTYKMEFGGIEGLLYGLGLLALPLVILAVLLKVLPAWKEVGKAPREAEA